MNRVKKYEMNKWQFYEATHSHIEIWGGFGNMGRNIQYKFNVRNKFETKELNDNVCNKLVSEWNWWKWSWI